MVAYKKGKDNDINYLMTTENLSNWKSHILFVWNHGKPMLVKYKIKNTTHQLLQNYYILVEWKFSFVLPKD
jgi:hypothetical protein